MTGILRHLLLKITMCKALCNPYEQGQSHLSSGMTTALCCNLALSAGNVDMHMEQSSLLGTRH